MAARSALDTSKPRAAVLGALVAGLIMVGLPTLSGAWPAVQDVTGVHLCNSRPVELPDGRWSCRSYGAVYEGSLVEVSAGPTHGPGIRPPLGPYPYPSGPPRRGTSGYDELDPWLGGPSQR
jgi:hypothetical protein